jgi:predicted kinase
MTCSVQVFVICGSPASGKTTYGTALAKEKRAVLIDIDACTERVVQAGLALAGLSVDDRDSPTFKAAFRNVIYEQLFDIATSQLESGSELDVVIVGPFTRELRDPTWRATLATRLRIDEERIHVHWVVADDATRFQRMLRRANPRDAAKLADYDAFLTYYGKVDEPPTFQHTRVDTSSSPSSSTH